MTIPKQANRSHHIFKATALSMTLASVALLVGCNDDDKDYTVDPKPPVEEKLYLSESLYQNAQGQPIDQIDSASSITVMRYKMPNVQGKMADATALLMIPKQTMPKDGWRVVVWEHGTLGVADNCAPSKAPISDRVKPMAQQLLDLGYVVIAVDYEGLGTEGMHPYLHVESEANAAIYAVKAFKEGYGNKVNGAWMAAGQSQGGQAAIGTAEYANDDAHFKGAVAGAPASNLAYIITQVAPKALAGIEAKEIAGGLPIEKRSSVDAYATLLTYAAFAGAGVTAYEPDFDFSRVFKAESRKSALLAVDSADRDGLCMDPLREEYKKDIITFMKEDTSRKVMDFPGVDESVLQEDPVMKKFISELSQPGQKAISKPLLIIQGEADTSVPHPVTEGLFKQITAKNADNKNLEMISVPGAGHTQAIIEKRPELLQFIQKHMPNNP